MPDYLALDGDGRELARLRQPDAAAARRRARERLGHDRFRLVAARRRQSGGRSVRPPTPPGYRPLGVPYAAAARAGAKAQVAAERAAAAAAAQRDAILQRAALAREQREVLVRDAEARRARRAPDSARRRAEQLARKLPAVAHGVWRP
jgi:hypothetical protein